ncbi:helix-turn-helix domain-containing protein [Deinococcus sp.]|uniref:helix-turn-helix domain-containing protein n=1 Tax=Deinococcus sp. TaxID=47478 RepID=UPI003B5C08CE
MTALNNTLHAWTTLDHELQALVSLIATEADYTRALSAFETLMGQVGQLPTDTPSTHPLKRLYFLLAEHIAAYERQHLSVPEAQPHQVLQFLMERHGLHQTDLPEVGSQGVVSELLSGKRQLNTRQVKRLAERFGVSPSVFL